MCNCSKNNCNCNDCFDTGGVALPVVFGAQGPQGETGPPGPSGTPCTCRVSITHTNYSPSGGNAPSNLGANIAFCGDNPTYLWEVVQGGAFNGWTIQVGTENLQVCTVIPNGQSIVIGGIDYYFGMFKVTVTTANNCIAQDYILLIHSVAS